MQRGYATDRPISRMNHLKLQRLMRSWGRKTLPIQVYLSSGGKAMAFGALEGEWLVGSDTPWYWPGANTSTMLGRAEPLVRTKPNMNSRQS